ncbi:hypothetical protein GQ43DRAFT_420346 [Delitschia confertaspora ATCC 74209]|uniref:Uncharacterized protein n=1 Tax=Delitschia confertaspora ATCC 74209 TaxID=1513339 RepID=A0A9P4MNE2_9PLEO|nr:hypothetical protein GQ43DRAFT_420346 [Delitschia confertaspora ATCC 74209]
MFPYPPFTIANALSKENLEPEENTDCNVLDNSSQKAQVESKNALNHIPGAPTISLTLSSVYAFLQNELATPLLDELYPNLWLVARKSGRSIDALHAQKAKGREIVVTENAGLHLCWKDDRVYVKPIPECLLNYQVWTKYLGAVQRSTDTSPPMARLFDQSAALGFLRSYAFLIRHPSDFKLALEASLIPTACSWTQWSKFIANFHIVPDESVAQRYHYGQLRLSRLNWAVRLFRPQSASNIWFYHLPIWSISAYVEQSLAPLVFCFGSLSLVLSSMQVMLAIPTDSLGWPTKDSAVQSEMKAFWVFSIIMLFFSGLTWVLLFVGPAAAFLWQFSWGYKHRNTWVRGEKIVA